MLVHQLHEDDEGLPAVLAGVASVVRRHPLAEEELEKERGVTRGMPGRQNKRIKRLLSSRYTLTVIVSGVKF